MRETRADNRRALVDALALHVVLFALMFAGMWWTRSATPLSAAGPAIEADLIDPDALSAPMRRALDAPSEPPPQVEPETAVPQEVPPPPQAAPQPQPQDFIPEPDTVDQERVERDAEAARQAALEQEERRRQEQIDLTERKRQEEAERKRAEQLAKQQEIADKLAKIRAERAKAEKQARQAEQKLKQLEDARSRNAAEAAAQADAAASPPPGNEGRDNDLTTRYAAALQAAILRNWTRPDSVPLGQRCRIVIRQIPGGEVIDAQVDPSCPYDELGRRSIEAAVLKAQPLPYAGFEQVFQRTLRLNFEARER